MRFDLSTTDAGASVFGTWPLGVCSILGLDFRASIRDQLVGHAGARAQVSKHPTSSLYRCTAFDGGSFDGGFVCFGGVCHARVTVPLHRGERLDGSTPTSDANLAEIGGNRVEAMLALYPSNGG